MILYTDGSTAPTNPGPGGYTVVEALPCDNHDTGAQTIEYVPVVLGSEPGLTTNIRMEGLAIIDALRLINQSGVPGEVRTDSLFWINVMTKWIAGWRRKNFRDVKNPDLVLEMDSLFRVGLATLTHVRGHKGEPGNEMADHWANKAREGVRLNGNDR